MNTSSLRFIGYIVLVTFLSSCEDKIKLDLPAEASQLVVEAKVIAYTKTDFFTPIEDPQPHYVKLSLTNGFDAGANSFVSDAIVALVDLTDQVTDTLQYKGSGVYKSTKIIGKVGHVYGLGIQYNGNSYFSVDTIKRVPNVDSIAVENRDKALYGRAPGFYLNLLTQDLKGAGDFYRIKTYKNSILFNRPQDINLAYDAGFSPTSNTDGTNFVFPIAVQNVNPNTGITDEESRGQKSTFVKGDVARIEIWSLSIFGIIFYNQLRNELTNEGLFARPAVNLPTNIINLNPDGPKAVGCFSVSAVSGKEVIIQ